MIEPLKIGIDCDGCIYDWTRAVNEAVMERFGVDDPGAHTEWDHLKKLLTREQFSWVWTADAADAVFGRLDCVWHGAVEAINTLAVENSIHFVTHRNPKRLSEVTGRWLAQHFDGYRGVHTLDNNTSKTEVCLWDVFIDDKEETIDEFLDDCPQTYVLMPMRDWNVDYASTAPTFDRFNDWAEVPEMIEGWLG